MPARTLPSTAPLTEPANTFHNGHGPDSWLDQQRQRAASNRLPADRAQVLHTLAPYWNPPRHISRQRMYTRVRLLNGRALTPPLRRWINTRHRNWQTLHPDQQTLLHSIGLGLPRSATT
ncbi:hypothetical protein [Streptomyces sp. ML-6]|uniref:hypothetical protein n=1 Tax=Streptomyces sp. ML-6 TaxID=2982693 RepID=UPI0024BF1F5D|nr:hypothetical protein [Streptomyces sp. ML-6]MDK0524138.1 hypothetical protein [Streptomyces sp. ML-6]